MNDEILEELKAMRFSLDQIRKHHIPKPHINYYEVEKHIKGPFPIELVEYWKECEARKIREAVYSSSSKDLTKMYRKGQEGKSIYG